jgi:SNF2 family DNA or RNA helicase
MANWTQQVQDHVQEGVLNLKLYHVPNRRAVLGQVQQDDNVDILLVSYQTLAADFGAAFDTNKGQQPMRKKTKRESLFDIHFHRIVLDEAVCRMVL